MEKVLKLGIKKRVGFLYYLDKQGDISEVHMTRGIKESGVHKPVKINKCGVKREKGYLYFVDKQGDLSRAKMKYA